MSEDFSKNKILWIVIGLLVVSQGYMFYKLSSPQIPSPKMVTGQSGVEPKLPEPPATQTAPKKIYPLVSILGAIQSVSSGSITVGGKTARITSDTTVVQAGKLKTESDVPAGTNATGKPVTENNDTSLVALPESPFEESPISISSLKAGMNVAILTDPDAKGSPIAYKIVVTANQ